MTLAYRVHRRERWGPGVAAQEAAPEEDLGRQGQSGSAAAGGWARRRPTTAHRKKANAGLKIVGTLPATLVSRNLIHSISDG